MTQSRFRPIKYLKMTVRTSVLWKINIHIAKKWPGMVVHRLFIKEHSFVYRLYVHFYVVEFQCWWSNIRCWQRSICSIHTYENLFNIIKLSLIDCFSLCVDVDGVDKSGVCCQMYISRYLRQQSFCKFGSRKYLQSHKVTT